MHFYDEPGEFTEEVLGDWFDRVWKHYTSTRPEFWCGLSIFGAQVDENGKTIGQYSLVDGVYKGWGTLSEDFRKGGDDDV